MASGRKTNIPDRVVDAVDGLLELSVVGSFSRVGYLVRRSLEGWVDPDRLDDKTMIVTGASSGIGKAVAIKLAALGANVWLIGRDPERLESAAQEAKDAAGGGQVHTAQVDLNDAEAVSSFVDRVMSTSPELHALVHNAGALFPDFGLVVDSGHPPTEQTMATHVLAPFRLSWLLAPMLVRSAQSVIVTVTSGGMYTQGFDAAHIDVRQDHYRGAVAYGRAKRTQVVLSHEWARRWGEQGVASYAVHPGWVDTPGLASGLPTFAKLGPLLRSPEQGADTVMWLAADEPRRADPATPLSGLWHDRRRRGEYYLPTTRRTATQDKADGRALWDWCVERTGYGHRPIGGGTQ